MMDFTSYQTDESTTRSDGQDTMSAAGCKSKKRVITPARKEQNRVAQKLHREKKREQIRKLRDETGRRNGTGAQVRLRPKPQPRSEGVPDQAPSCTGKSVESERSHDHDVQLQRASTWATDATETAVPSLANDQIANECLPWSLLMTSDQSELLLENGLDLLPAAPPVESCLLFNSNASWRMPNPTPGILTELSSSSSSIEADGGPLPSPPSTEADPLDQQSVPPTSTSSLLPYKTRNAHSLPFPSPQITTPQHGPTAIFLAVLHNATALGFDIDLLIACTQPSAPFYMSPFYRQDATPHDDPELLVSTTLSSLGLASGPSPFPTPGGGGGGDGVATLPANLRPTLAQILIPHHASLDLVPLPRFRDRVIMLAAAMPHFFSLGEFKVDIYCRGAMMIGGGGSSGRGGNDNNCQPWEPRSWDVAPWFVRKWCMAVDKDNELGRFALPQRLVS